MIVVDDLTTEYLTIKTAVTLRGIIVAGISSGGQGRNAVEALITYHQEEET
jgi:hypothetical protein